MQFMRTSTQKKRDYVISVALKLFNDNGFENVSVDDIVAAANTSKGTFYHYFKSKNDIVPEVGRKLNEIVVLWLKEPPSKVVSLEGHINRLFLDLASNLSMNRKLIRKLISLTLDRESPLTQDHFLFLAEGLMHWLPDRRKAELLVTAYLGTVLMWSARVEDDLEKMLSANLAMIWAGMRSDEPVPPLQLAEEMRKPPALRVAVIGGGLAGLTAAAYLSADPRVEGMLFERSSQVGGRAFTYEKSGYTLNYGAHAIYGIDRHTISTMEDELGLSFSSKQVDKRKVMYAKNGLLTQAPLDFVNLIRTGLLNPRQKVKFVAEISAMIAQIHTLKNYETLGDYLALSDSDDDLKELWEHLVCSNFFITPEDARKVPGQVISDYYHNLFLSGRPVNYILGSWAAISNQLRQTTELSGRWQIAVHDAVEGIRYADRKFVLRTKSREEAFDKVIFAMPVQQVIKLLKGTPWEPFLAPYEGNTPTEVMVYDVGLSRVVARPFNYISDMDNKMFISDVSATDHTLVPEGGQLLQGIAYLADEFPDEAERKSYLDGKTEQMEQLFDKHYPGWREHLAVKRVSKRAMVASVKNIASNRLLPVSIENVPFYFCGDGCQGKGELAERAFSSARKAAKAILAAVDSSAR